MPIVILFSFTFGLASIGLFIFLARKSTLAMLLGIELLLNASIVNFVGLGQLIENPLQGQLMALFILAISAGEAALILAFWKKVEGLR